MVDTSWLVSRWPPIACTSAAIASAIRPAPPAGNGQPSWCALPSISNEAAPLTGSDRRRTEWAAAPAKTARAASSRKRRASQVAGCSPCNPNNAEPERPPRMERDVERAEDVRNQLGIAPDQRREQAPVRVRVPAQLGRGFVDVAGHDDRPAAVERVGDRRR